MRYKIKILKTGLALLAAVFIFGGCAKENMDNCGVFRLQFRYTYNIQGQDQLTSKVHDIRIYAFNAKTGILAAIIRVNRQDIADGYVDADLPAGTYTLVAWAGSGDDLMQGGFRDNPPPATIGTATLEDFRMMLAYKQLAGGEIAPQVEQFDDLFFAIARNVSISKNKTQTVDFDFIKNTSMLKVKVTGLDYLTRAPAPNQPLNLFVLALNASYRYDNTIDGATGHLRYEPPAGFTASDMEVDIKVLRLDILRHTVYPVRLYLQKPDTAFDMIEPLNVLETILQIKNAQGAYVYQTQEDIDREDEFMFEFSILNDLSVKVTVNGFEIEDLIPNLK